MITANELKNIALRAKERDSEEKKKLAKKYLESPAFKAITTEAADKGQDCVRTVVPDEYLPAKRAIVDELAINGFGLDWTRRNDSEVVKNGNKTTHYCH